MTNSAWPITKRLLGGGNIWSGFWTGRKQVIQVAHTLCRHGERGGPGMLGRTGGIWWPIGYGKLREGRELKLLPKFHSFIQFSTYSVTREWRDEISWGEKESRREEADLGNEIRCEHIACQCPTWPPAPWPVVPGERRSRSRLPTGVGAISMRRPGHPQTHNLWCLMKNKNVGPLFKQQEKHAIKVTEYTEGIKMQEFPFLL